MLVSLHRHSLSEMRTTPSKEPKDQAHNDHRSNMAYVHVRSVAPGPGPTTFQADPSPLRRPA